jgi:membrane protein
MTPSSSCDFLSLLRELRDKSRDDNVFNGAAALGFFLTLAIFPAMILVMGVIPYLPIPRVDQAIMGLLQQVLPQQAYQLFSGVVQQVVGERRGGVLSLGALATLWAASTGMYAVMQQLNVTYGVKEGRGFLRARAVAIVLSLLFGAVMLVAFSLIVLGGIAQDFIGAHFGFSRALLDFFAALRWVIVVLSLALAFSLTYYLAPNVRGRKFAFVSVGGASGTALLLLASGGFAVYVQNFAHYSAVYGGIGAVIALMLWLYIAGLALLVGSEINVIVQRRASAGWRAERSAREASA